MTQNILSALQSVRPRILLVDNDPEARISYQALLLEWGYEPILAMGVGSALQEDARIKARKSRCSLALIDLRLKDDDDPQDMSGADFAESIKILLKPIILTGAEEPYALRNLLQYHQDIPYIGKQDRRDEFRKRLDAEAAKVSAAKRSLEFIETDLFDDFMKSELVKDAAEYPDQVADILVQLFPNATKLRFEKISGSTETSDISSAIRPNSVVLKVHEDNLEPCTVKLARARKIQGEVRNYSEFISRKLTGGFSAHLLQQSIRWDIGGAAYTYISGNGTRTFSAYYKDQSIDNIEEVLKSFFWDMWGKKYTEAIPIKETSLFNLYSQVWGGDWLEKCSRELPLHETRHSKGIQSFNLPIPLEWLKNKIENPVYERELMAATKTAVTHGDLHGDNLMVDDKKNVWVVDFERSGVGHALQDFIELEADVLNRLLGVPINIPAYLKMCMTTFKQTEIKPFDEGDLNSGDANTDKALKTISILRRLAFQVTGISNAREYVIGLFFNMLFRAALIHKIDPAKSELPLLLAGFISHRLDHWDEPWPPAEWNIS